MSHRTLDKAREFFVDSRFQKMARRPGGIPREQALKNANENVDAFKPEFTAWLDDRLNKLFDAIPNPEATEFDKLEWIDAADIHSQQLADVAATMDYQFVSFVANNLCMIFEALKRGAEHNSTIVACHVDALRLARQQQYRGMRPEDLPELSDGLRRVLNSPNLQPKGDDDDRLRER